MNATMEPSGAVLGVDIGFSKRRKTTGSLLHVRQRGGRHPNHDLARVIAPSGRWEMDGVRHGRVST